MIGVSGSTAYLGETNDLPNALFRHIDYFVQLVGPEYVGLGTDYVHDSEAVLRIFAERPDEWPTGELGTMQDIAYLPPEGAWSVVDQMVGAGYDRDTVLGILGGNWLRVAQAVWR